jgi:hypothetical protein
MIAHISRHRHGFAVGVEGEAYRERGRTGGAHANSQGARGRRGPFAAGLDGPDQVLDGGDDIGGVRLAGDQVRQACLLSAPPPSRLAQAALSLTLDQALVRFAQAWPQIGQIKYKLT